MGSAAINYNQRGFMEKIPIVGRLFGPSNTLPNQETVIRLRQFDEKEASLAAYTRQRIIQKYMSYNGTFPVNAILGELSSVDLITESVKAHNCSSINIVMGPKFRNEKIKSEVKEILENDSQNRVHIRSLTVRPKFHGVRIGDSLFIEDPHEENQNYEWATLIPNATEESIKNFVNNFHLKKSEPGFDISLDNIDSIDVIDTSN